MAGLVPLWRASGLTAETFAKREKVAVARLWYWKKRIGPPVAPSAFLPLRHALGDPYSGHLFVFRNRHRR